MFLTQSDKGFASLTCFMAFLAHFFAQFVYKKIIMTAQKSLFLEGLPINTTYHLPLTAYHLPLTTYHLLLTAYGLPLTTYYLPLTTRDGQAAQKLKKLKPQPSSFELEFWTCPERDSSLNSKSGSELYDLNHLILSF